MGTGVLIKLASKYIKDINRQKLKMRNTIINQFWGAKKELSLLKV